MSSKLLFSQENVIKVNLPTVEGDRIFNIQYKILNDSVSYLFLNGNLFSVKNDGSYQLIDSNFFYDFELYNNLFVSINRGAHASSYYLTKDIGKDWIENDLLDAYWLSFVNDTLIYGINDQNDKPILYSSNDLGFTWKKIAKLEQSTETIHDIYFLNPKMGFYYGSKKGNLFLYKTIDYGKSWKKIGKLYNYDYVIQIKFIDEQNGYLYCRKKSNNTTISNDTTLFLKTIDGGNTWNIIKIFDGWSRFFEFTFITPEIGWFIEDFKLISRTTDGGKSFQYLDFLKDEEIYSIECKKDGTTYIVSSNGVFKTTISSTFTSENEIKERYNSYLIIKNKNKKAQSNYDSDNWQNAFSLYKELIEIDGEQSFQNYFKIGYCCFKLKEYNNGIIYFEKAIDIEPNNYNAYLNLGVCYENIGKYEEAQKYYEIAVSIDPENELAKKNLTELEIKPQKDLAYQCYNNAYIICIQQSYSSHYYNTINYNEINKAMDYCRIGLELNAGYESDLKFILNTLERLLKDKELHPELYK